MEFADDFVAAREAAAREDAAVIQRRQDFVSSQNAGLDEAVRNVLRTAADGLKRAGVAPTLLFELHFHDNGFLRRKWLPKVLSEGWRFGHDLWLTDEGQLGRFSHPDYMRLNKSSYAYYLEGHVPPGRNWYLLGQPNSLRWVDVGPSSFAWDGAGRTFVHVDAFDGDSRSHEWTPLTAWSRVAMDAAAGAIKPGCLSNPVDCIEDKCVSEISRRLAKEGDA